MADRHLDHIGQLTARLTAHTQTIAHTLTARQPSDDYERPPKPIVRRGTATTTAPEGHLTGWETAQHRDGQRYARLLTGHDTLPVHGALEVADQLGQQPPRRTRLGDDQVHVDQLAVLAGDPNDGISPDHPRWRAAVHALAGLWHATIEAILDGHQELVLDAWTTHPGTGLDVEDGVTVHAMGEGRQRLERLEHEVAKHARRIAPATPRLCACGCRKPLTERDRGRLTEACQKRRERTGPS